MKRTFGGQGQFKLKDQKERRGSCRVYVDHQVYDTKTRQKKGAGR